ncbi:MAG TPA: maleylacetate reductase [Gammaproteobacteria bacterium]|nr:maleylacetate reductase [Gammaproteobacteria bacterium]|tara:strand:- start:3653 stop:4822 length:1170 start_codon:yes stop_codon:yes gene_type:complete
MEYEYSALERVLFGESCTKALPGLMSSLGYKRPLIVASSTLAEKTQNLRALQHALSLEIAGFNSAIRSHTPREDALELLHQVRESEADVIISVGGGSVIDAGKFVQLAIGQGLRDESEILEYAQQGNGNKGPKYDDFRLFSSPETIRQIAIPTTLSGAEFSNSAGVLNTRSGSKEGYRGPRLCPQAIVYDPKLASNTPSWLWLSTAIRSLDHAIEGYCSGQSSAYLDAHFLQSMTIFSQSLPAVKVSQDDVSAVDLNQQAVWLACCGLGTVPHGASHGIGYILGALCGVPHGYTSCVMLPAVLAWNAEILGKRGSAIASAMGEESGQAHEVVKALIARLGLPTSLKQLSVPKSKLKEIAERAYSHPVVRRNPRSIDTSADVREILELAW